MSHTGFLKPIIDEHVDLMPIVMIDKSGSTSGKIMEWQLTHIERIMKSKNIEKMNVIFWGSNPALIYPDVLVDDIIRHPMGLGSSLCGTDLSTAFHVLPKSWYRDVDLEEIIEVNDLLYELNNELNNELSDDDLFDDDNLLPFDEPQSNVLNMEIRSDQQRPHNSGRSHRTILPIPEGARSLRRALGTTEGSDRAHEPGRSPDPPKAGSESANRDIYIVTDGELIQDQHNFREQVTRLVRDNPGIKFRIYIICVEGNENNYEIRDDLQAGGSMYKTICDARLAEHVYSFVTYNKHHMIIPFVNIEKFDTKVGFIPWRNMCFSIMDMYMFLDYISDLIEKDKGNIGIIKRISHDLCTTLYHIVKMSNNKFKYDIIDTYIQLFSDTPIYEEIKNLIYNEIINKESGISLTYIDYRNKRQDVFKQRQLELYKNAMTAIRYGISVTKFMTFPIYDDVECKYKIFIYDSKDITFGVRMRDKTYKMGGVKIGDNIIPVLPMIQKCIGEREEVNQCIRQYIRAIMSYMFNINVADDMVIYLFLTMMLRFDNCDTDIDPRVVNSLIALSYVLLNRTRFQTKITELEHLMTGNPPLTVVGDIGKIVGIFRRCAKIFDINCRPYSLWANIISALGDVKLLEVQNKYCEDDIDKDSLLRLTDQTFSTPFNVMVIDTSSNSGSVCYITGKL